MDITTLLSFVGATALLAISPGPDNIYVLIQSITNGVKAGISTVLGLVAGCLVHTSLVAFGVSAIIKESEALFFVLKLFGAGYLIYLALKAFKTSGNIVLSNQRVSKKTSWQLFRQGFIMNVLNPKVSIFFLAFFPGFLFSQSMATVYQFFILGLTFMGVSLVIFSLIAFLAGAISKALKRNTNVGQTLKWLQISVFVLIAIFILFSD